eukprot:6959414-Prymnesium_polylepis.2
MPIEQDFPYRCSAGVLGSGEATEQTSPLCAGLCTKGHVCGVATTTPERCKRGFCPEGSSAEQGCKAGRFSNATGLSAAAQCTPTDPGFFAPTGSVAQTACAAGTVARESELGECAPCDPGMYQDNTGATECKPCESGSYCPRGASAPLPCKKGSFSSATNLASAAQCTPADPGFFAPTGSVRQSPCAAGTVAREGELGECAPCDPGTYQDITGTTACKRCEMGSYCKLGAAAPLPCEGGTFSSATDLTSAAQCTVADPGHFSPTASAEQRRCRADTYNPVARQSSDVACVSCSRNSTTDGWDGQTSVSSCICLPDYYEQNTTSKFDTGRVDCRPCLDVHETSTIAMTNCSMAGATLDRLPLLPGFWRQRASSMIVRACDDREFCVGGDEPGDASCADGRAGPLCDLCQREPLYYGGRGQECQPCSEAGDPTTTIGLAIGGTVAALVVLAAL